MFVSHHPYKLLSSVGSSQLPEDVNPSRLWPAAQSALDNPKIHCKHKLIQKLEWLVSLKQTNF